MPLIDDDLRIDIREAMEEACYWVRALKMAVEGAVNRAEERTVKIELRALGKFAEEADGAVRELDNAISDLLKQSEDEIDPGDAATALAFYGNPRNHVAKRGEQSEIAKDGGAIARKALAKVSEEEGE